MLVDEHVIQQDLEGHLRVNHEILRLEIRRNRKVDEGHFLFVEDLRLKVPKADLF